MVFFSTLRQTLRIITVLAVSVLPGIACAEVLVLGSVNQDIRKHLNRFAPLAAYLEEALAPHGVTSVETSVFSNSGEMATAMREGKVDLYFDSPLVAASVARRAGAEPFLRRWKSGVAEYHSVLVVKAESRFRTVEDLQGVTIGFQEPDSTSGFLLPAALLTEAGLKLKEKQKPWTPQGDGAVNYVFTGDDINTVAWLARGLIDVGATDPRGLAWLEEVQPGAYRVLARTVDVPRQVVIRRGDLDPALTEAISVVLQDMVNSGEGIATMAQFNKTTRFDPFPQGVEATFDPIYQKLDLLETLGLM
ncbi:MAG: phosphate/phosphite/phosphonate ABC transporter substrate-binding protein [Pseudomonadota bacterium]